MANTALITGSYGGLGTCFTDIHARTGGNLVLVGRSQEKLDAQAKKISNKYHVKTYTIAVDLSKSEEAAQIIYDTCHKNGWQIDMIINNAGFGGQGDFARERSMEQDLSMIAVNIETPTRLLKLFLPDMIKRGQGKVLNVSSTAAVMPGPLQAVYYATKAYVTSWSNSLWRELKGTGVTVTTLMPGAMDTGFAKTGGLTDTKAFAHTVKPDKVAEDGYKGMIKGELNVVSGLPAYQKPFVSMTAMFPKKMMLDYVYSLQIVDGAKE